MQFTTGVVAVAATLYLAACCLPATEIGSLNGWSDGPAPQWPTFGWAHLAFGWLDFPHSLPAWSANFVLGAGMLCALRGGRGSASALGILAVFLGLTTLTSYKDEGRYIGFNLWVGSQMVFAGGTTAIWVLSRWWKKTPIQALEQEIWDSIAATPQEVPLTEAQKQVWDRRIAELKANPDIGLPWEEIKARIQRRQ